MFMKFTKLPDVNNAVIPPSCKKSNEKYAVTAERLFMPAIKPISK